jgi:DNA mismatch endonuclease (patch repair protein)
VFQRCWTIERGCPLVDVLTPEQRTRAMSCVKGRNTRPELAVRRALHQMGYRFRLHRADLPGRPDIVLPQYRVAIFVNGCFWHGHEGCPRSARPAVNTEFWNAKLSRNVDRDRVSKDALIEMGWTPVILWTCELKSSSAISATINSKVVPLTDARNNQRIN